MYWSALSVLSKGFANVIIFLILAKNLSVEDYGRLSFSVICAAVIIIFIDCGINTRITKELSQKNFTKKIELEKKKNTINFLALFFITAVSILMGDLFFLLIVNSYIILNLCELAMSKRRAKFDYKREFYLNFLSTLFFSLSVFVSIFLFENLNAVALGFLLGRVISYLVLILMGELYFIFSSKLRILDEKEFTFDFILTNIWGQIDHFLVRFFFGLEALGIYHAYSRIINGFGMVTMGITNYFFPKITSGEKSSFENIEKKIIIFSIGMILILYVYSEPLILYTIGDKFLSYSPLLTLMLIPLILKFMSSFSGILLIKHGEMNYRIITQLTILLVSVLIAVTLCQLMNSIYAIPLVMIISYATIYIVYSKKLKYLERL